MRRFTINEYDDIFSCFPISEEVCGTTLYAVKFVKHLCEREDVYQPYPCVEDSEIYMKIPNDGTVFMDINIAEATVKLQFNETKIYYRIEYDSAYKDDKCGTVKWDGESLPDELYHILYKNPIRELLGDSYSHLSAVIDNFSEIEKKYRDDNDLVPSTVIDDVKTKKTAVTEIYNGILDIMHSRKDGWKDLTKCNE